MLLAVYGTLKRGHSNNFPYLTQSKFMQYSQIDGIMLHLNAHPGVVLRSDIPQSLNDLTRFAHTYTVNTEIWEVDDLALRRLDQMEGHPEYFKRVPYIDKKLGEVHIYTLPSKYLRGHRQMIPSGCWTGPTGSFMKVDFYEGDRKPKIMGWGGPQHTKPAIWTPPVSTTPRKEDDHPNSFHYDDEFAEAVIYLNADETIIDLDEIDVAKEA